MYDRERHLREAREIRRRYTADWFVSFYSVAILPWLHRIAKEYKEKNGTHINGITLLPQYYTDVRDKEIAALASLFITDNYVMEQVQAMRRIMVPSPWEWFANRGFVELGTGQTMNKRIGGSIYGAKNIDVSSFFDDIYTHIPRCFIDDPKASLYDYICSCNPCYLDEMLDELAAKGKISANKLRWYFIVLEDEVYGSGALSYVRLCPITDEVKFLVKTFFPDYRTYGTIDDAIRLFDFDDDVDFFYAAMAYKELSKQRPKDMKRMNTSVPRLYKGRDSISAFLWKKKFPWMFDTLLFFIVAFL